MSLPILPSHPTASTADLIRFYYRTDLHWCQQVADQTQLRHVFGAVIANAEPDLGRGE